MIGPGAYVPDPTEGITRPDDLPPPRIVHRRRLSRRRPCPRCGHKAAPRYDTDVRHLLDFGDLNAGCPVEIHLTYSRHRCRVCRTCFGADLSDLAEPKSHYTRRVQELAVRLVVEDGMAYRPASWHLWRDHRVFVPFATIQNWVEAAGKKSQTEVETAYLDRVLDHFSGYIAIDELYQHPYCILSLVDNRTFTRLASRVLEHDPTAADMHSFLAAFKARLDARGLSVKGITTDGSSLYPEPLKALWPGVRHQVCRFHVLKEIIKAVLHTLAAVRKTLAGQIPKLPRGRPRCDARSRARVRRAARLRERIGDLFEHRHLFVRRTLTASQKRELHRLTRGLPHLRILRAVMDEVYGLFDRRCRTQTALDKLTRLRRRLKRFQTLGKALDKLHGPNLEKALTYLDDKLLPGTSNAVERGNRRYRKTQKAIYSVRTAEHIRHRVALDLLREERAARRQRTLGHLHKTRSPTRVRSRSLL